MLKSLRLAVVVSVASLALTTACSSNKSSPAAIALAIHLKQSGAKMYGAYWCAYCHKQKVLFGKEAFSQLDYVECDPAGENARPALCQKANIDGFPTWQIRGKKYPGLLSLQDLADLSSYHGDRNFPN